MRINAYLSFDGRCEEAFKAYAKILGGKIESMFTYGGSPAESDTPREWREKIMHARLAVGDQVLMGADAPPQFAQQPQGFSVSINVDEPAEADHIFSALAEKGTVRMPIEETFWARRFGMVIDRFGIPWMVNCEKPA